MSEKIDWSKAPEGATHWEPKTANVIAGWMRLEGGKWFFWPISTRDASDIRWHECLNDMSVRSEYMIPRPTTTSWSGEGLPPVGVVCEWRHGESHAWQQITIIAYHSDSAWVLHDCGKTPETIKVRGKSYFRPIRTTEQIAADEREAAVTDMHAIYMKGAVHGGGLYAIYDAGYRKP